MTPGWVAAPPGDPDAVRAEGEPRSHKGFFSAPRGQARTRRAADLLLLLPALVGLAILVANYPPGPFEQSLIAFLDEFPGWLHQMWEFAFDLLAVWAVFLVVSALVARRRVVALQAAGSLLLAAVIALVSARIALGSWPDVVDALGGGSGSPIFPAVRVAEAAAVVLTVGPHLVRPLQSLGRWILLLGVLGAAVVGHSSPKGVAAGLLIAMVAAASVRLALGTSAGRPGLPEITGALAELGVRAKQLEMTDDQMAGVILVRGRDPEGMPLLVKVLGRDAYDNQLLSKLWRTLWYQHAGPGVRLSRSQVAQAEALVTLLAQKAGVPTEEVVTVGTTARDDALLVLRMSAEARSLRELPADSIDDELLRATWQTLARLRSANIAHRRIDPSTVTVAHGEPGLTDFGVAKLAPSPEELQGDRAQLLATTAAVAGSSRAIGAAVAALGRDQTADLLPYVQTAALGGPLRKAVEDAEVDVDELREATARAVGIEAPELVRLQRVTWRSLIQPALLILAASAVITYFGSIDFEQLKEDLADASWGWVVLGFAIAQVPRLTQAVATLGSVAARLPFGPVYAMQLATNYMNLALPSYAARMAVNIRFFQRQGLSPTAAATSGAIDSFASTIVQGTLLALLLLFATLDLSLDLNAPAGDSRNLLWIVLGLLVATVLVVFVVRPVRRAVVGRVRAWWPEVRASLGALRDSDRLVLLIGGNVATEILFATTLGIFALALGSHIGLAELLVINITVSLFASFIPVPGGIGVSEFGLTTGLTAAGMSTEPALAAVILYRLASFYIPPVWGYFALRWLERNRYL